MSFRLRTFIESTLVPVVPQIQVTLGCNFACTYCFQGHRASETIDPKVAGLILAKCARYNSARWRSEHGKVSVFWHGGEPLLAGLEFYREMLSVQAMFPSVSFVNHIQTNGSMMTDDFAEFLVQHRFHVGFSLDGPQKINDRQRRIAGSVESAYAAAWNGIQTFKRHAPSGRIPIIAVITRESITRAKELYSFFKEIEAEVQLDLYDVRCSDLQPGRDKSLIFHVPSQEEARDFLIEMFDLWFNDTDRKVDFSELRNELDRVLDPQRYFPNPIHKKRCHPGRTIFDPKGRAFVCDQHINDDSTSLGDIRRDSLPVIMHRKANAWNRIKQVVRHSPSEMACSTCVWGTTCNGGCVACLKANSMLMDARSKGMPDHFWPKGEQAARLQEFTGESYYCEAMRGLRAHIQKEVRRELQPACQ